MAAGAHVVAYLALGSNQGERLEHLRAGVHSLDGAGMSVRRASSVYEGPYVGTCGRQNAYLNAVVQVVTHLTPLALLERTQGIERARGRAPDGHQRPRPLDIDVLWYGDGIIRHPRLVVPHPRIEERRFVLEPLAEIGALRGMARRGLVGRLQALRATQTLRRVAALEREGSRESVGA